MKKILVYLYNNQSHLKTLFPKHHHVNQYLSRPIIRSYTDSSDFKISFLKDKCGLSGKPLIRACECLDFDSSDHRPDSVLELFRSFGFPHPNITRILSIYPCFLLSLNPQEFLKPKLDFLLSISQSQAEVVSIVTKNPVILCKSLTNFLIPSLELLNSFTGSCTNTLSLLKYNPYIISQNVPKSFLLNTQFLLTLGVPHSQILKLLTSYGATLATPHDKFRGLVLKLKDMAFDLKSSYFLHALKTLTYVNTTTWESRCVLLRSFGFSDQEILSMFKILPQFMNFSEKTIIEKTGFYLNKLHWTPSRLSNCPCVLSYSLEKRAIPRFSVLQVLVSKDCTSESYMLSTILKMTDEKFVKTFVTAYKDEVPEVMEAYQGKLRFDVYTFKQKEQF